nr:lipocalin-like domain-containing protein [Mangrovicoccus ximenensis]
MGQGFAGLGQDADGFALPQPDPVFRFPRDHGPHPRFRIEWWYVTANLKTASGEDRGIQWTLFRSALAPQERPGWASPQIWFAHAAMTRPGAHLVAERRARGGIGEAADETGATKQEAPAGKAAVPETGPAAAKPELFDAAPGDADDLRQITGVGPKLEDALHALGVYTFAQIASWGPAEIAWIDENFDGPKGRITRDDWVGQAKALLEKD